MGTCPTLCLDVFFWALHIRRLMLRESVASKVPLITYNKGWVTNLIVQVFIPIIYPEREPVRPCNFHAAVIGGFVAHTGPFELKWWLWFLYRPKMVLLVVVTTKNAGFGYYVGHMPHKFINQKPKKIEENQKKQRNQKKQSPGGNPWAHFSQDFGFYGFFGFFGFLRVILFFLSPVADENFRV